MIKWVTVETTKGAKQHALDPESSLRAGIYRRALCGHEIAVANIVNQERIADPCKGCVRRWRKK